MRLTEAGKVFLTEARAVLQRVDDAVQMVKAMANGQRGEIHVGYGFSAKKDLLAQLPALNQQVAAKKIEKGEPVTAPGVPKNCPDAKKLVTQDCIRPAEVTR